MNKRILIVTAVAVMIGYPWLVRFGVEAEQRARDAVAILNAEADLLELPPPASEIRRRATQKTGSALVTREYRLTSRFKDVYGYYDQALRRHGWRVFEGPNGPEYGIYQKGAYRAALSHPQESKTNYRVDFWLP